MAASSSGCGASLASGRSKKSKCCPCNGRKARCKSCICCRSERVCVNCLPSKRSCCSNSNSNSTQEPESERSRNSHSVASLSFSTPTPSTATCHPKVNSLPSLRPQVDSPNPLVVTTSQLAPEHSQLPKPILPSPQLNSPRNTLSNEQVNLPTTHMHVDLDPHKEPCIVEGCNEHIAPTMWLIHMTNHAKGVLPGAVPTSWLREQSRYICPNCSSLVANSHSVSHSRKCPSVASCSQTQSHDIKVVPCSISHQATLPCLQDICSLRYPTIRFVPSKARPAFARALSSVLKEILAENSVDAWTKLLMLPKCVLPTTKRGGRHNKPIPIDTLCSLWLKGNLCELWHLAQTRVAMSKQSKRVSPNKVVASAMSLAKDGLYGKACQMLTSQGIAPNDDNTWNLLISKHPQGPCCSTSRSSVTTRF